MRRRDDGEVALKPEAVLGIVDCCLLVRTVRPVV